MSLFQFQRSIDSTVFKTFGILSELIRAAGRDDVQCQVVLALEALGSTTLVSSERISEGFDALNGHGQTETFEALKIYVGLSNDGISQLIRKRVPQCLPGFLLIASLKTGFADWEIRDILFEMLERLCLLAHTPVSRTKMGKLVAALSGYGDSIIPAVCYEKVSLEINSATSYLQGMEKVNWKPSSRVIAEVFVRVFNGLKNQDVQRITLHGLTAGTFIVSSLLWLLVESFELVIDGRLVLGGNEAKVVVELSTTDRAGLDETWVVQEWRLEQALPSIIVKNEEITDRDRALSTFYPASSTRTTLASQYSLSKTDIRFAGILAGALVIVAVDIGKVRPDSEDTGIRVSMKHLCQPRYLAQITTCMEVYGWDCNESFVNDTKLQSERIKEWLSSGCPDVEKKDFSYQAFGNPTEALTRIINIINKWHCAKPAIITGDVAPNITISAAHIAAESLYSAFCNEFPIFRSVPACRFSRLRTNTETIMQLIFQNQIKSTSIADVISTNNFFWSDISLFSLRVRAIEGLLPDCPLGSIITDHMLSANGYVAVASPLRRVSTVPSECIAINLLPGKICWGDESTYFERLSENYPLFGETKMSTQGYELPRFDGVYKGLEPRREQGNIQVTYLLSPASDRLLLTTYVNLLWSGTQKRVRVNWFSSISCSVFAEHVSAPELPTSVEEELARSWLMKGVWEKILWKPIDVDFDASGSSTVPRHLSITYGDEVLRFFYAGSLDTDQRVFIQELLPSSA